MNNTHKPEELNYILSFACETDFDNLLACQQLRSLWTAYCFHSDLDVDTHTYDNDLLTLWENVESKSTVQWDDFDSFDRFMAQWLV